MAKRIIAFKDLGGEIHYTEQDALCADADIMLINELRALLSIETPSKNLDLILDTIRIYRDDIARIFAEREKRLDEAMKAPATPPTE